MKRSVIHIPTRFRWQDALLIILLLPGIIFSLLQHSDTEASYVIIRTQEAEYRYALHNDRYLEIQASYGVFSIAVSNGQVNIIETHCPAEICRTMGPIHTPGQSMLCIPQRIEVSIPPSDRTGVDAVCQ